MNSEIIKANNEESKLPLLFPESPSAAPRPILPKGKNWKLFDLDSLEISRQLTLIEAGIFVKILPHELYKGEWLVKNRKSRAGNVRTMTSFSTSVKVLCRWTGSLN